MSDMQKIVKDLLYRIGAEIKNEAQREAPYRTGNLRNDLQVFDDKIAQLEVRIGQTKLAPYAVYVHVGTGISGPKKARIYPKKKKALNTPWGPRKSIAGQKPNPYMTRALANYKTGGLNRALDYAAVDIGQAIIKDIRAALKSPNIVIG